jgi:hypothetical protein
MKSAKRRSREFWRSVCREFKSSGRAAEAFARARGLHPRTLQWWVCEFRREARGGTRARQPAFVPVEVVPADGVQAGRPGAVFEVVLGGGTAVKIPADTDTGAVRDLLRAVVEATRC